jgi:uncharacterized protein YdeI (YjbR/CyaY-like superfamily)
MTEEGRIVFQARKNPDSKGYKAQKKIGAFDGIRVEQFQRNKAAWAFFRAQPPGYQKQAAWWVMQAKQEATRTRRLDRLIQCSTERRRLA